MKSILTLPAAAFSILLAGCLNSSEDGALTEMQTTALRSGSPDKEKTFICHVPPGNPENAHTIHIGNPAVPAHLDHGDALGACGDGGGGGGGGDCNGENPDPSCH
jgi:hypothetical protein